MEPKSNVMETSTGSHAMGYLHIIYAIWGLVT
jgi:hypothetical protein